MSITHINTASKLAFYIQNLLNELTSEVVKSPAHQYVGNLNIQEDELKRLQEENDETEDQIAHFSFTKNAHDRELEFYASITREGVLVNVGNLLHIFFDYTQYPKYSDLSGGLITFFELLLSGQISVLVSCKGKKVSSYELVCQFSHTHPIQTFLADFSNTDKYGKATAVLVRNHLIAYRPIEKSFVTFFRKAFTPGTLYPVRVLENFEQPLPLKKNQAAAADENMFELFATIFELRVYRIILLVLFAIFTIFLFMPTFTDKASGQAMNAIEVTRKFPVYWAAWLLYIGAFATTHRRKMFSWRTSILLTASAAVAFFFMTLSLTDGDHDAAGIIAQLGQGLFSGVSLLFLLTLPIYAKKLYLIKHPRITLFDQWKLYVKKSHKERLRA